MYISIKQYDFGGPEKMSSELQGFSFLFNFLVFQKIPFQKKILPMNWGLAKQIVETASMEYSCNFNSFFIRSFVLKNIELITDTMKPTLQCSPDIMEDNRYIYYFYSEIKSDTAAKVIVETDPDGTVITNCLLLRIHPVSESTYSQLTIIWSASANEMEESVCDCKYGSTK